MGWSVKSNEPLVVGVIGRLSERDFDVVLYIHLDWEGSDLRLQEIFCWTGQETDIQDEFQFNSGPQPFRAQLLEKLSEAPLSDRRESLTIEKKLRSLLQQNRTMNTLQKLLESDTLSKVKQFLGLTVLSEVFAGDNNKFGIRIASLPTKAGSPGTNGNSSSTTDSDQSRTYFKVKPVLDPVNGVKFGEFVPGDELMVKMSHHDAIRTNSRINKKMKQSSNGSDTIQSELVNVKEKNPESDEVKLLVDLTQDVEKESDKVYGLGEASEDSRVKTQDPKFDEGLSTVTLVFIILGILSSIVLLSAGITLQYPEFFLWLVS